MVSGAQRKQPSAQTIQTIQLEITSYCLKVMVVYRNLHFQYLFVSFLFTQKLLKSIKQLLSDTNIQQGANTLTLTSLVFPAPILEPFLFQPLDLSLPARRSFPTSGRSVPESLPAKDTRPNFLLWLFVIL